MVLEAFLLVLGLEAATVPHSSQEKIPRKKVEGLVVCWHRNQTASGTEELREQHAKDLPRQFYEQIFFFFTIKTFALLHCY